MTTLVLGAMRLDAPCKVNLTLDVGRRRGDGYHDLDSVVALFHPADSLAVTAEAGEWQITLGCSDPALPSDERNLAHRAASRFLEAYGLDCAIHIDLEKRLPAEAGLGGGSSDAAAVLRALRVLFPDCGSDSDLRDIGASIGSDVPLFLCESAAVRMSGRGEIVAPLPDALSALYGVIVRPAVGVSTAHAYGLLDAQVDRNPGAATPRLLEAARSGDPDAIAEAMSNDFEAVILDAYPEVARAHRAIRDAGAMRALLCGSGSAVFGLARDPAHARDLAAALEGRFPWVQAASGVSTAEAPA